jgi:hypothetical protein
MLPVRTSMKDKSVKSSSNNEDTIKTISRQFELTVFLTRPKRAAFIKPRSSSSAFFFALGGIFSLFLFLSRLEIFFIGCTTVVDIVQLNVSECL